MGFTQARCPVCDKDIYVNDEERSGFCFYCGEKIRVDESIRLYSNGALSDVADINRWRILLKIYYDSADYENAEKVPVADRAVEDGDTVNIDYTGYVDGEELEGGKDTGFDLPIGSGSFIDGFEEGLIGTEIGEMVELELTGVFITVRRSRKSA